MTKLSFVIGCTALIAVLAGCSKKTTSEMAGIYIAEWSFGQETLSLRADGTYEQRFVPSDTTLKPVSNSGTWNFDGQTLTLKDPIVIQDPYGDGVNANYSQKNTGAIVLLRVKSRFGKIVIQASANSDVQYKKQ